MTSRYAVFYAPPADGSLWGVGSSVLGYDAESGAAHPFPADLPCSVSEWRQLTEEPRRYGFHGTLKAPFHLVEGATESELLDVARDFALGRRPFDLPRLRVSPVGRFVALVCSEPSLDLQDLAAASVEAFDPFRAPLTTADRARRLAKGLSDLQVRHLDRWGYPYVFDEFRFHMTLTGPVPEPLREAVRLRLERLCAGLADHLRADAIAIFRQDAPESRFRILSRLPFGDSMS